MRGRTGVRCCRAGCGEPGHGDAVVSVTGYRVRLTHSRSLRMLNRNDRVRPALGLKTLDFRNDIGERLTRDIRARFDRATAYSPLLIITCLTNV